MRCGAKLLSFEFVIALPDDTSVFACGVPDLRAEETTAVRTYKFCSEEWISAVLLAELFTPFHFKLDLLEILWIYNCFVTFVNVVLWYFTFVDFFLFRKKISGKTLLQQCRPLVFFVSQNTFNCWCVPLFLTTRR